LEKKFDITIKNVLNNEETTSVTWSTTSFRQNWVTAEQYVELDLDLASPIWSIKIYTDNGAKNKNGLIDTADGTRVLPMCWRVNDLLLPVMTPNVKTLTITESSYKGITGTDLKLYDGGAVSSDPGSEGYWCWFIMTDVLDTEAGDYAVAWNLTGFHAAENSGNFYGMNGAIFPKVYLGAYFADALGRLTYSTNIKFVLTYE